MRDYLAILRRNLLSPIVIAIFLLAGALIYVREYRDAWFISVVIVVNSLIGIVQEIRAKRVLRKLELMSAPRARVERPDGKVEEIGYEQLRPGDVIVLQAGDELPADAQVLDSKGLEVNESMLTGESAAVAKSPEQGIWAATTILAGSGRARVTAVGDQTKAGAISQVLKRYKPQLTPLQKAIQHAITFLTFGAIGLAAIVFMVYFFSGQNAVKILKTITAAAVTVVPEGLLLASSLLLAFGALRLAQAKVLPQKLSAIEAMALLNLLCVDKTGTLTSDEVTFERVESFGETDDDDMGALVALIAQETSGGNITGEAICSALTAPDAEIIDVLAFSSERKMAGVRAKVGGEVRTLFMGAPEFLVQLAQVDEHSQRRIDTWTDEGLRVLLVAEFVDDQTPLNQLMPDSGKALGAVILRNSLRDGVTDTVAYLQSEGVDIRVISGDNPRTVQYIAGAAGIDRPDRSITGQDLAELDEQAFEAAAENNTIFARVLPEQKERLISHFRERALFTGMVGDGVNDALALKQADLGVAMYAGAPASRRVADLILLNNSFTSLPMGMRLGNRIMQAIEIIATLFFHKIIYGVVLLVATLAVGMIYPFAPRHITYMNMFLVTMPTLMWTLFPPLPHHRVNPAFFWRDTLRAVAPIAVLTGGCVMFGYWSMSMVYPGRPAEVSTMTVLIATFFGIYLVFLVGPMLGVTFNRRAALARSVYLIAVIAVTLICFSVPLLRDFFDFTFPNVVIVWPALAVIVLVALVQWWWAQREGRKFISDTVSPEKKKT